MTHTEPKYPDIHIKLTGEDGNAVFIVSRVMVAMRRAGIPSDEVEAFEKEATSNDYDHLLRTVMQTVNFS